MVILMVKIIKQVWEWVNVSHRLYVMAMFSLFTLAFVVVWIGLDTKKACDAAKYAKQNRYRDTCVSAEYHISNGSGGVVVISRCYDAEGYVIHEESHHYPSAREE